MNIVDEADRLLRRSRALLEEMQAGVTMPAPVSIQPRSSNRKLAPQRVERARSGRRRNVPVGPYVASTYVSIEATCPDSCSFKGGGCYAQEMTGRGARMDRGGRWMDPLEVTRAEADAISSAFARGVPQDGHRGGRDLRLHVSGDVSCDAGARLLSAAADAWLARGGGAVWTYTHRWREIPREAWGPIAVLASVERLADMGAALERGYAPAIVVPEFPSPRAWTHAGIRIVPCPSEAGDRTCATCRLCLDPKLAQRRTAIAFALHGHGADKVRARLPVVG